jgi:Phosducin
VECKLVEEAMMRLAPKFKYVKFIKIRSTQAIENWPEKNLPTIFFYHGGELQTQLITLSSVGGKKMTAEGAYCKELCKCLIILSHYILLKIII